MLLTRHVAITGDDTAATLHDRLALEGADLIVQALHDLQQGGLRAQPQPQEGITYAHKIDKPEAAIDWQAPAELLERRVRAFDPFPGATAEIDGQTVKVWRARVVAGAGVPGQRLDAGAGRIVVACGEGALELLTLQLPGGRRITTHDFLHRQAAQARA
jgi:methionyl-tRNA formyltransferase